MDCFRTKIEGDRHQMELIVYYITEYRINIKRCG